MRLVQWSSVLVCLLAIGLHQVSAEDKDVVRENLNTAIPYGIKLLEAKEYLAFLKAFVEPEQLKKFSDRGDIEEFANKFGEGKSRQLLLVLKQIKDNKPTLSEDGKKAAYDIQVEGVTKKGITFTKVGKYWYINN